MNWKQPIPTNLDEIFGGDHLSRDLYVQLLLRSANKDGFFTDEKTKRTFVIKRGDVVFGRNKWAELLRTSPASVYRALQKLEKTYQKVNNSSRQGFTVVSIKNYDEVTGMNNSRTTGEQVVNTSKSVKSVKSVKREGHKTINFRSIQYLKRLPDIEVIAKELVTTPEVVRGEAEKSYDWIKSKGRKYSNYRSFLKNWVRRALEDDPTLKISLNQNEPDELDRTLIEISRKTSDAGR